LTISKAAFPTDFIVKAMKENGAIHPINKPAKIKGALTLTESIGLRLLND